SGGRYSSRAAHTVSSTLPPESDPSDPAPVSPPPPHDATSKVAPAIAAPILQRRTVLITPTLLWVVQPHGLSTMPADLERHIMHNRETRMYVLGQLGRAGASGAAADVLASCFN